MGKNQDPGSGINIPDPQHLSGVVRIRNFLAWPAPGSEAGPDLFLRNNLILCSPQIVLPSVADPGCLSLIPDPNFFSIPVRIFSIPDTGSATPKNCF
jgi:hypothetical protein